MARTRITSRLASAVSVFFHVCLPPGFTIPYWDQVTADSRNMIDNKWTRCFRALSQVNPRDLAYIKCARRVEDPSSAIFFISTYSAESMDALLETPQYKDCLAALGLEQPPALVRTAEPILSHELKRGRMTITTFCFPYPATQEQRDGFSHTGRMPIPEQFSNDRWRYGWYAQYWVRGPQELPDARKVETALVFQQWPNPEDEDTAAGEELEARKGWVSTTSHRLGLLDITVERYNIYYM